MKKRQATRHSAPKPTTSLSIPSPTAKTDAAPPPRQRTEKEVAEIITQSETMGAMTIQKWAADGDGRVEPLDFDSLLAVLKDKSWAVVGGDMSSVERTATTQAMVLDCVFNVLLTAARCEIGRPQFEALMRMAFRAQSQCARTLEALAAIKNPAIITRQVNVANQQVVNNGSPPGTAPPPPAQIKNSPLALDEESPNLVRLAKIQKPTRQRHAVERRTTSA